MPRADQRPSFLRYKSPVLLQLQAQGRLSLQLDKLTSIEFTRLSGQPIRIYTREKLVAHRGRLLAGHSGVGSEVHAAAFIRDRKIILEACLLSRPRTFRLILIHELFHFVWPRLNNTRRKQFGDILTDEWRNGARGELGESSDVTKQRLRRAGVVPPPQRWRDYVCESFCDTAAWLYAPGERHGSVTLRERWANRRKRWFEAAAADGPWKC